jgi:hypothetical protein
MKRLSGKKVMIARDTERLHKTGLMSQALENRIRKSAHHKSQKMIAGYGKDKDLTDKADEYLADAGIYKHY